MKSEEYIAVIASIVLILLVIGGVVVLPVAYYFSDEVQTVKIKDKERITTKEDSYYLVYTDKGVFKVADSLLYFDWNSSDRYAALEKGNTYTVQTHGWRLGLLSMYPNVVEVVR